VTYCRICPATCGLVVDVEDNRVVRAVGDVDNPLTRGFSCPKGRHIGDFLAGEGRLRTSMRRNDAGELEPVDVDVAIEEIATRLKEIIAEHGVDAVAFFAGTQSAMASLTGPFADRFARGLGTHKTFSTMTIDQSAKWVADGRIGMWAGGRQRFTGADVWMLVGTNPVVSLQGGDFTGFPIHDPVRRLQEEQARGMKLIVVDPRRTEVASRADIHLQLRPGTDVFLFAGVLQVILAEELHDAAFCDRWVEGVDELRAVVAPFTPAAVAVACGVDADDIVAAARTFAGARHGMAHSGTGPDMGPRANLAEHLIRCLNVVCGRYALAGDLQATGGVLGSGRPPTAHAIAPDRTWERGYRSRFGYGLIKGQLPAATLPDEIMQPGDDRVRAVLVCGSNPGSAMPDQAKILRALGELELLVTVDPFLTETAQLAHYVIAPKLHLERPDTSRAYDTLHDLAFGQYTPAVVEAPPGTIDDWEFWLRLAWAMDQTISVGGRDYAPGAPMPTTDEVLASFASRARVPLGEVKRHPHGALFPEVAPVQVQAAGEDATDRLQVMAPDVAAEAAAALAELTDADGGGDGSRRPYRLVVRRRKETMNSLGRRIPGLLRHPYNPCHVHPDDLAELGIPTDALVAITSDHGTIHGVTRADATMRRGAVSMTHAFGGLPGVEDDPLRFGANPTRLLSVDEQLQSVSAMPLMSAVPVSIEAIATGSPA
jgi:anaerobic selenocysteine-containing dehydrogenase